jgi:uncharacterized protein YutE (UPF0331/DUF86 family)
VDIQTLEKFYQNASLFRSLAQSRVFSEELTKEMEDMARFRNLLVHL